MVRSASLPEPGQFAGPSTDGSAAHLWHHRRMTTIRAAAAQDLDRILSLLRGKAAFDGGEDLITASDAEIEAALFGDQARCEVLVAESHGQVVGFASFFSTFSTFHAADCLWLDDLFVDPDQRSRGIGRELLVAVADQALARGCARLEWLVATTNERGLAFYRRCGASVLESSRVVRLDRQGMTELVSQQART